MRGNQGAMVPAQDRYGSIPAHAGKPDSVRASPQSLGVYPRPCGETFWRICTEICAPGLSPPMRGNLAIGHQSIGPAGSIPAHAGKPSRLDHRQSEGRVYPRPCGETAAVGREALTVEGLSPPMRGNPCRGKFSMTSLRSIPAHAGKPEAWRGRDNVSRVYPRPCGETVS